jgi:PAS domain S-box-containing protein
LIVKEDRQKAEMDFSNIMNNRQRNSGNEYTGLRKNGETFPLLGFSAPIVNDSNEVIGFRSSVIDFKNRRAVEKKLQAAYSEMNQIFNDGEAMCLVSNDIKILKANDSFGRLFDVDPEKCSNSYCSDVLPPAVITVIEQAINDINNGIEHFGKEFDLAKGSRTISGIMYARPFFDPEGKAIIGIVVSIIDISQRKKAENELRKSQSLLNAILSSTTVGMALYEERSLIWINKALTDITGYTETDLSDFDLIKKLNFSIPEFSSTLDNIKSALDTYGFASVETAIRHKSGERIYILIHLMKIDSEDNTNRIIVTVMDLSEQKKAQELKEASMAAIIEAGQKKFEALQVIEDTSRLASIGVIAGSITHEINQPLNAIKIGSDSILLWNEEKKVLPEVITKVIKNVSDAAKRIDEIVSHMRSFWADNQENQMEVFDINPVVDRSVNFLINRIKIHEIELELSLEDRPLPVKANKLQLEIVINNLVNNAVHSLDKKQTKDKRITLETFTKDDLIYLRVEDNGTGLPAVPFEMLFDPFFTTKGPTEGTGLGLAIVDKFVKKFGAEINVENLTRGGAAFTIIFKKETAD